MNIDYTKLTWTQMAEIVEAIWAEMKRRNPIFINYYASQVKQAGQCLREMAEAEAQHPTSDHP